MSTLLDSIVGLQDDHSKGDKQLALRALAWARVSTDMQEERGQSMPEQLRQIREYAESNNIVILEEYYEAASAFKKNSHRTEFDKMLARAKSDRKIDAILVHDYSRFSRDSLGARLLVRDLRQAGVRVISLNDMEVDSESVAGVYMEAITFAKNEAYSREVAFHTKKGCRANIQTRDSETGWCYKNGGQPLFGYRSERLMRGEMKKGRPLIKSIWVPDDREVAGKTVHEWARYCLVDLAAKGATLDELRDFCNGSGIPAPRQEYWGHTTWNSILHPHCLLQYAGYGVWNVRGKTQRINPPSEWVIVENAHEALISEDVVQQILEVRKGRTCSKFTKTSNRTHSSRYLLSGGLFTCSRCGSNLMGMRKSQNADYYICGSQPHRRGLGCGTAVYVPQSEMEREVIAGLEELLKVCADPQVFVNQVNQELRRIWEECSGYDPSTPKRLADIDRKIANIRSALEDGLADTQWANSRLTELTTELSKLGNQSTSATKPPKIDTAMALSYRRNIEKVLAQGSNSEKKQILKTFVDHMTLTPDTLEVEINYRVPESMVNSMGAAGELIANYAPLRMSDVNVRALWRRADKAGHGSIDDQS